MFAHNGVNMPEAVAGFGNNVVRVFREISSFRQTQPKLNMFNCFDFVERIVQLVAFDNVASTLLLVWAGLNANDQ